MSTSTVIDEADLPLVWAEFPPGPELGIQLAMTEWSALSDRELAAAMDAARRQATWAQSLMLEGVAELSRRRHGEDPYGGSDTHRRICGEVSLELTVPTGQAEEFVVMSETLPTALPRTWAAMRTGQLDYDRARVMADGVIGLDESLAHRLDAELIGDAVESTKTLLRRRLTTAIKKADPDAHAERTKTARNERRVELWENGDDTCDLVGRNMSATDAHAIRNRLTAAAQAMKADGDVRSIDQIRADLHCDLLRCIPLPNAVRRLLTDDIPSRPTGPFPGPAAGPPAPTGNIRPRNSNPAADEAGSGGEMHTAEAERLIAEALGDVAGEQLTAVFDRARADGHLDGLAHLIGDAAQAMRAAIAGKVDSWCRATCETSHANKADGHGHPGYRPPAAMQRLIQRRHATCAFPTCNRQSINCDLDHTVPFGKGGRTCKCNMAPLCRAHHRIIKQHPTWKLVQLWPGLLIWVAPTGTWHIVTPQ
jgi:hypothetical protein